MLLGLDAVLVGEMGVDACICACGAAGLEEGPDSVSREAEFEDSDGGAGRDGVEAHLDAAEPLVD